MTEEEKKALINSLRTLRKYGVNMSDRLFNSHVDSVIGDIETGTFFYAPRCQCGKELTIADMIKNPRIALYNTGSCQKCSGKPVAAGQVLTREKPADPRIRMTAFPKGPAESGVVFAPQMR